jgi:hypothetical protein
MEHYETALDGFLSLGDLYHMSKCHCGIRIIHGINEDYQIALERFEEALRCAKKSRQNADGSNDHWQHRTYLSQFGKV